jgi:hypothetical protein
MGGELERNFSEEVSIKSMGSVIHKLIFIFKNTTMQRLAGGSVEAA